MRINKLVLSALLASNLSLFANSVSNQSISSGPLIGAKVGIESVIKLDSSKLDKLILDVQKQKLYRNKKIKVHKVDIGLRKILPNNWVGYIFDIDLTANGRRFVAKDIVFTNGIEITSNIKSLRQGFDYKRLMHPTLDKRYYEKKFLIAGDENATHKMVVFSDPLCPICIDVIPSIINNIKYNPKNVALYYIHMPLKMHPTATTLVRASIVAKEQGIKNIDYKIYTAEFKNDFDAYREKDQNKVLQIFNKKFGTSLTIEQINTKELKKEEELGLYLSDEAFVNGTPTIFLDGKIDITRSKYLQYLK